MKTKELITYLLTQKDEIEWVCEKKHTKKGRTLQQNNFYYGMFSELEKQTPFSADSIKQYILSRVFGKKEVYGELINRKTGTSKLDRKEAGDLINGTQDFIAEHTLSCKYVSVADQNLFSTYN